MPRPATRSIYGLPFSHYKYTVQRESTARRQEAWCEVFVDFSGAMVIRQLVRSPQFLSRSLEQAAGLVRATAERYCPVDTGLLKRSIYTSFNVVDDKGVVVIGVDNEQCYYGGYVEFGTSRTPAQPFLRPAIDENRQRVVELVARGVANELGGALDESRESHKVQMYRPTRRGPRL